MIVRVSAWLGVFGLLCSVGIGCSGDDDDSGDKAVAGKGGGHASMSNAGTKANGNAGKTGADAGDDEVKPSKDAGTDDAPADGGSNPEGEPLAMDECGLDTKYAGDEYCILPPPPDKGFQLHIGPSDYDNPEPQYVMAPGAELTTDFAATSTNDKPIYFYYRQFRMRNGAHHNIISNSSGGLGLGSRIGTSNNLSEDNPKGNIIAPENKGVGIPLAAHAPINVSLHSINSSEEDQLREIWVNFWYRPDDEVTEPVNQVFATGSVTFAIPPGADTVLGPFSCNVTGSGRMLWMYGHRHANNVGFSVSRIRGTQRDSIYEAFKWEEPLVLEYSTTVTNTPGDIEKGIEGGWNGILDLEAGDKIEWSCHVINKTDGTLRFTNNTYTGEMCIVDAELVGANCGGLLGF